MKKMVTLMVMITIAITMTAQRQNMQVRKPNAGFMMANPQMMIPNLTADQQSKINELRVAHYKANLQMTNEINEKRAQLRTLEQTDRPSIKAINAKIDELTALQNKKYKLNAEHRAEVRNLLTDEQKVEFDMRGRGPRGNKNYGMRGVGRLATGR